MKEIQILNNGDALYDIRRKINENFELVQTEVEEVVVDPLAKFGINEGNVTDGVADLLTLTDDTLSFKVGGEYPNLVMTSGDGTTTEIESVNDLYLQNLADGEYKILINGEASQLSSAEFYSQLTEPQNINNGDVWFNGEGAKQYLTNAPSVTAVTPKTTINYKCMGNIDDLYIAAGGGQYFYISRDGGTTWESKVLPANVSGFLSCVVKDGYFYFATSTSSIMRTAAGEDPEVFHQFADTFYPQKIKVINDLFILTASGPTLSTSSDGKTWNTITIGTEPIIDVFYIDDLYYIISRNGTIYTSEDLVTVTQKNKIVQSTYVQCAEVYKDTIIMGGISGSLYIYNFGTDEITLNNISSSEVILDMQVRPNGAMIFVGSNNMCKITYDFITFQNLYTSGGYLEHIYKDFIMGQAGSFLRINQTVQWFDYPWVPVGEVTISGGEVTYFTTYPYNSNGLHEASSSTFGLLRTAAVTDEMDCTCNDAVITPSNLYDLSNYRMANTSYEVEQKVGCPYHHNLQLRCSQAGTTSNEGLNTKGYLEPGTTIEDGTVIWEVQELGSGGNINDKVTNCILEIPKRLDYSFADGTITIKAGSVFVFPQGTEDLSADYPVGSTYRNDNLKVAGTSFANGKFFVLAEMQSDMEYSPAISGTDTGMLCYVATNNTFVARRVATQTASGTSTPTSGYWLYYNTSENKIYNIANGSVVSERTSLPLLTLKFVDGVCDSIGQVFNGMGFIGNTIWADKGIKGLIPNGRNVDGTLKNTEFTTDSVLIYTKNIGGSGNLVLRANSFENFIVANYNEELNLNIASNGGNVNRAIVGTWTADSNGFITKFESKFPFRAVDYEDFEVLGQDLDNLRQDFETLNSNALLDSDKSEITSWGFPIAGDRIELTIGATQTKYTAPATGWFMISKYAGTTDSVYLRLATTAGIICESCTYGDAQRAPAIYVPVLKGHVVTYSYNMTGENRYMYFMYAKGAQ